MRSALLFSTALTIAAVIGCRPTAEPAPPEPGRDFEDDLRHVSTVYKAWGPFDGFLRTAVVYCAAPGKGPVRYSQSTDSETHGNKLYYVYAKLRDSYSPDPKGKTQIGQVLVKETWLPEETKQVEKSNAGKALKIHTPGKPAGLFIMMKLDPKTPDTDEGWVYGTVSVEGTVTSSGKVVRTGMLASAASPAMALPVSSASADTPVPERRMLRQVVTANRL